MGGMSEARTRLIKLIQHAGGTVEDELYVTEPGVMILQESGLHPKAVDLLKSFNIQPHTSYEGVAELNARLTYLAFSDAPSPTYLSGVTQLEHLSIYGSSFVTFLLAGLSLEASLELIAHREARAARLTSSRTKAMNDTLYRVHGPFRETQREAARDMQLEREVHWGVLTADRDRSFDPDETEAFNRMNLGSRATALTYTMSLKDFHSLFIGRFNPKGNELEVQDLCTRMCTLLHERYPVIIRTPAAYRSMSNGAKYALGE